MDTKLVSRQHGLSVDHRLLGVNIIYFYQRARHLSLIRLVGI